MPEFYKLKIKSLEKVTEDCVTIGFQVPTELKDQFSFKAGQYVTLKTIINNEEIRRDYSLCSSPYHNALKVAVKEVKDGVFSKYANNELSVNDAIEVSAPRGRFIYEPNDANTETIVAFAAGSGITPIMSIIKTVLEEEQHSKMILVYGNKTPKSAIFLKDIQDLQSQYAERFLVHFVFSQSQENEALFGRIEKSTVNYIVKNQYKDHNIKAFYLCGPEVMIETVSEVLKENEVPENKIHFELFTTSQKTVTNNSDTPEGSTSVTVMVDDEETSFVMSQKKSILEAALEQDIDAPFSCQGGICSSCLARISNGSATMRQNNILTDSEVEEGLILTCQAHPTSPTIYVDYDDV